MMWGPHLNMAVREDLILKVTLAWGHNVRKDSALVQVGSDDCLNFNCVTVNSKKWVDLKNVFKIEYMGHANNIF